MRRVVNGQSDDVVMYYAAVLRCEEQSQESGMSAIRTRGDRQSDIWYTRRMTSSRVT